MFVKLTLTSRKEALAEEMLDFKFRQLNVSKIVHIISAELIYV